MKLPQFRLDPKINFGNLLTLITIIISAAVFANSLSNDFYLREKEQADRVRTAAAQAITKFERWQMLQLSLIDELQEVYVDTSDLLGGDKFDISLTRDYLWRHTNTKRTLIKARIFEEQVEVAYIDLLTYFPQFEGLLTNLDLVEREHIGIYLEECQQIVLAYADKKDSYAPPQLGNDLRGHGLNYQITLKADIDTILEPVREFLLNVLSLSDREILDLVVSNRTMVTPEPTPLA